jgi:hypothetical protein
VEAAFAGGRLVMAGSSMVAFSTTPLNVTLAYTMPPFDHLEISAVILIL